MGGAGGMPRCDAGTTATLIVFFLIGLFAGGRLRGGAVETIALTAAVDDGTPRAPSAPPAAAGQGAAGARDAPGPVVAARVPASVLGGDVPIEPKFSFVTAGATPAPRGTGGAGVDDDGGAPAGNRFAGLEKELEVLPLPRGVLPHEPAPPTTTAQVLANASLQPVLPTVFVPCCAKTGTTFLWGCTSQAFRPNFVCGSNKASEWTRQHCADRRYVLPGYRISPSGCRAERKEFFFWGGGKGEDGMHFRHRGVRWLTGMPTPLYYWQRNARACHAPSDVHRLCYDDLPADIAFENIRRARNQIEMVPADGRIHPACRKLRLKSRPPALGDPPGRLPAERIQLEVECALPWLNPRAYPGAVNMDFTPNHMSDPLTPLRLWDHLPRPRELKFVVTLRNPLKRAYSEWSMFVKWNWERVKHFGQRLDLEVAKLRACNGTIFRNPSLILTLPHKAFSAYHAKCFTGQAMEYVRNSMYIIGFRNMMRLFHADQFLVIWTEVRALRASAARVRLAAPEPHALRLDMRALRLCPQDMQVVSAADLLKAFADFTGLTFNPAVLDDRVTMSRCRTSKNGRGPNHQSFDKGMVCARPAPCAQR